VEFGGRRKWRRGPTAGRGKRENEAGFHREKNGGAMELTGRTSWRRLYGQIRQLEGALVSRSGRAAEGRGGGGFLRDRLKKIMGGRKERRRGGTGATFLYQRAEVGDVLTG
jgi:hypothetical protein